MVTPKGPLLTKMYESQIFSSGCVSTKCISCLKDDVSIFRCKNCHSGCYCSKECQKKCWQNHKPWCEYILKLETQRKEKDIANVNFLSKSSLTPKEEIKLVKLVGQKCIVDCYLDGIKSKVSWDTGAEVALVSHIWLNENFPEKEIKDVSELLGHELFLKVANNSKLEYLGYTEIVLKISDDAELLMVTFLVTEEEIDMPVIGYNVIDEIVKGEIQKNKPNIVNIIETLLCDVSRKNL